MNKLSFSEQIIPSKVFFKKSGTFTPYCLNAHPHSKVNISSDTGYVPFVTTTGFSMDKLMGYLITISCIVLLSSGEDGSVANWLVYFKIWGGA